MFIGVAPHFGDACIPETPEVELNALTELKSEALVSERVPPVGRLKPVGLWVMLNLDTFPTTDGSMVD
jgi:hypothetical protein